MSRLIPIFIWIFFLAASSSGHGQILPNSPKAYKVMMKAKKTNMCYIIKSKMEGKKILDTLIFNFKDFLYHFETDDQELVTVELKKVLKNYADCNGKGGLILDFKVSDQQFRTAKYCANLKKQIGKDEIYTCFLIETDKKASKEANKLAKSSPKSSAKKIAKKNCYRIDFFNKSQKQLNAVDALKKRDIKVIESKKLCL